ncbi:MAG: diaminopimelate epimerase [Candidatus Omnitrophica bacterium]|nr:diaminopimelate epimerase [Candidatus Omnitrophota bacterium]
MRKIEFYKFQASGNDFILIDTRCPMPDARLNYKQLARKYCQRKFGIGADGLLVIERSKKADFKMRIFNPDGSEPEMCGNGARCAALWFSLLRHPNKIIRFDTKAGIIKAEVKKQNRLKIQLSEPFGLKLDFPLKVLGKNIKVNFINTGVPHVVIFVQGLDKIDVDLIGRAIRFDTKFKPEGTNVNFVEFIDKETIKIRTYERGVESETLACGTGTVASAIISRLKTQDLRPKTENIIRVKTKSGEVLKVYFNRDGNGISDVWLEGEAKLVYKGEVIL